MFKIVNNDANYCLLCCIWSPNSYGTQNTISFYTDWWTNIRWWQPSVITHLGNIHVHDTFYPFSTSYFYLFLILLLFKNNSIKKKVISKAIKINNSNEIMIGRGYTFSVIFSAFICFRFTFIKYFIFTSILELEISACSRLRESMLLKHNLIKFL